ncbi:arylesterase [Pararhizobium mangrovi]|uniref:Arylesterase n=1 Tax=Pararhizobium mangrovi TaxID=2590452 RepID=A0A506TZQ9_9HYPH|nr:arylesterase [Pararhizobium mangrovi]TPW27000.1 arylesterase [Pararhizobium mangrovi]
MGFKAKRADFRRWTALGIAAICLSAAPAIAAPLSIVGFGDSLMAGYELPQDQTFTAKLQSELKQRGYDVVIANAGVSGDTSSDGLSRLAWSVPDGTDAVLLEQGANDALRGVSPEKTKANLDAMIGRLHDRGIAVLLVGMLAPPNMGEAYTKTFDAIFDGLAKKYDLVFYPFFLDGVATHPDRQLSDGLHPNDKGTSIMAERFLPYAEKLIDEVRARQAEAGKKG